MGTNGALNVSCVASARDDVPPTFLANDGQLICVQFGDNDRRVAGRKDLKRRHTFLGAECSQQADDAMRLQTVFQLVNEEGRRPFCSFPLQGGDKQARRAKAESAQRYSVFIMERDGT